VAFVYEDCVSCLVADVWERLKVLLDPVEYAERLEADLLFAENIQFQYARVLYKLWDARHVFSAFEYLPRGPDQERLQT